MGMKTALWTVALVVVGLIAREQLAKRVGV